MNKRICLFCGKDVPIRSESNSFCSKKCKMYYRFLYRVDKVKPVKEV